jgi:hypothetical protein
MFTGKIGFEDIAWGEGTETQAIGNGLSRVIHKVNAAAIPYDSTNTLKQIVDKILLVAENPDLLSVSAGLDDIKSLVINLSILKSVASDLPGLNILASKASILDALEANIKDIVILHETMISISSNVADSKARELRIRRAANRLDSKLMAVANMCTEHILPIKQQLDDTLTQVNNIADTIIAGNEMALKLGSYELKVQVHPGCIIPRVEVNDTKRRVTWHIPKPICATKVEVDPNIVQDSVDAYLDTLPNTVIDEDVTVDDLEPYWGYKLVGLADNSILVRGDSHAGGIILSRADNTGMSENDLSWFKLTGYDNWGTAIFGTELSLTYLSSMDLRVIPSEVAYLRMSFKRYENSRENDLTNIDIAFDNGKWRVQYD